MAEKVYPCDLRKLQSEAALEMDSNMEPPQANTTSVPVVYQPLIMVCRSGEAVKLAPYCQLYFTLTSTPASAAAALAPWRKP